MTEQKLIRLCKQRDPKAQKTLYERYQAGMFRLCYRYVRDQHEAEDVLCKAFLKVFQNIRKFEYRGKKSLEKWIARIMVNECLMFLRKQRFEFVSEEKAAQLPAANQTDSELEAEGLYAMIRALPIGYRTVFNLFAIEGFSHDEIAQKLGIAVGTSKSQLSKARAMLREMLQQSGDYHERKYRQSV
ncbi:MAG: sigma-70 family RNA polymerase sigma factor [Bacteroidota bacterium]